MSTRPVFVSPAPSISPIKRRLSGLHAMNRALPKPSAATSMEYPAATSSVIDLPLLKVSVSGERVKVIGEKGELAAEDVAALSVDVARVELAIANALSEGGWGIMSPIWFENTSRMPLARHENTTRKSTIHRAIDSDVLTCSSSSNSGSMRKIVSCAFVAYVGQNWN